MSNASRVDGGLSSRLADALDEYDRSMEVGNPADRDRLLEKYADVTEELQRYFETVDLLQRRGAAPAGLPSGSPLRSSARSFGDFEELEQIGRGGMGVVFKARQKSLNRIVALKLSAGGPLAGPEEVARFHREAEVLAQLEHPNIVSVHEVGVYEGRNYFSMDFVDGVNLAELLRDDPPSQQKAAEFTRTIATAMDYAHRRGVMHRDLKPANIMLDSSGIVQITDFGLGKVRAADDGQTQSGQILGTLRYMSPEQADGTAHQSATASDIYSIGAILYELLTGRPAFWSNSPLDIIRQIHEQEPMGPRRLNPRISRDLETICLKCLRKVPDQRYATAGELANDLDRFLRGEPVMARPISAPARLWRWCRRRPLGAGFVVVMAAVLILSRAYVSYSESRERLFQSHVQEIDRLRGSHLRTSGWRRNAVRLTEEAAGIRRDFNLRNMTAAVLDGLDAHLVKPFLFPATSVSFARTNDQLLLGKMTGGTLWNIQSGTEEDFDSTHSGPVAFDADDEPRQLIALDDSSVAIYDPRSRQVVRTFPLDSEAQAISSSALGEPLLALAPGATAAAACVAAIDGGPLLYVWDAQDGRTLIHTSFEATGLAFSPDARLLAAGSADGQILVWSLGTQEVVSRVRSGRHEVLGLAFHRNEFSKHLTGVRNQPTFGWLLATGEAGGTVTVWDLEAGIPITYLRGNQYSVSAIAFSPDGMTIATAGRGMARLWDIATGRLLLRLLSSDKVHDLEFSPTGRFLAIAAAAMNGDGGRVLWELEYGKGLTTLRGLKSQVSKLHFSPDGTRLAALSHDWQLAIWDLHTRQLRGVLETPKGKFADNAAIAFTHDGNRIAFSAGSEARMWDVLSGVELKRWPLSPGLADGLVFDASDQSLYSFRVETRQGDGMPDESSPPEKHPRIGRLRQLFRSSGEELVAEVDCCNWHVFKSAVDPLGRFAVVHGIHNAAEQLQKQIAAYRLVDGRQVWSVRCSDDNHDSLLSIDPAGESALVMLTRKYHQRTLLDLQSGQRLSDEMKSVLWLSKNQEFGFGFALIPTYNYCLVDGLSESPLVALGLTELIEGDAAEFSPDGRRIAWCNADGSVTVCEIDELRRNLAKLGLGW